MDEFSIEQEKPMDPQKAVNQACQEMIEDLKPTVVKLSGKYDPAKKTVYVNAKCVDNEEIESTIHKIFFDLLYYMPIDIKGKNYVLEVDTFTDPAFTNKRHNYRLSTSMEALPGTGAVTREIWDNFTSQLTYTRDGVPRKLPEPGPFWEEVPPEEVPAEEEPEAEKEDETN